MENFNSHNAEESLTKICSLEYLNRRFPEQRYTNQEIAQISGLLQCVHHGVWSAVPRLYIVLRRVGFFRLQDLFLSRHFTDTYFPFTNFSFPGGMGPAERSAFLQAQTCVLTATTHISRWDLGEHVHFASSEQVPLERKAILGGGNNNQVEVVVLHSPVDIDNAAFKRQLVRKTTKRGAFGRLQQGLEVFKNELHILKRVQHKHLADIIGSYTDPTYAALIMSPVADWDLAIFLRLASGDPRKMSSMRTFFGCLATALSYLHGLRIRHKDMKPSNILVHGANVLITDFGLSKNCNDTRSTTEGPTGRTPKYCAPEVADYAPRNSSSDIWSLGCVFLEMLTVIKGVHLDELTSFLMEHGTGTTAYHSNADAVEQWMSKLRITNTGEPNNKLLDWIEAMLTEDRNLRPSAELLVSDIITYRSASDRIGEFCGICCRSEDQSFFDVEMEDQPLFVPKVEEPNIIRSTEDTPISLSQSPLREQSGPSRPITHELDMTARDRRSPTQARFFILRSKSDTDIETSVAHQAWTAGRRTNSRLDKAYRSTNAPIYLIFLVVKRFCP
ncbi:kinase-like domain-containing protein [Phaeosphaeriaceae sp. PMI808]|nr:kinase-like domain-containing protein [Phaeosphaeriaceae sp. PMI808]